MRLNDEFISFETFSLFKPFSLNFSTTQNIHHELIRVEPSFGRVYLSQTIFDPFKNINLLNETFIFEIKVTCMNKHTLLVISIDHNVINKLIHVDDLIYRPIWTTNNVSSECFVYENVPAGTFIENFTIASQIVSKSLKEIQMLSIFNLDIQNIQAYLIFLI